MVDFLGSVDTDSGPQEPMPVTIVSGGVEVSLAGIASGATAAQIGAVTETAPVSDTASSGLNGRLQRIAQRITSFIALVPASLGSKTASTSFAVTQSTEDVARLGIITETAPIGDTDSSGINGRLQRIAQRLASLIALLPASLGIKAASASLSIAPASDVIFSIRLAASAAALTSVNSAATSGTILAANAARKGASISNTDANALYLDLSGGTASATNYSVKVAADGYFEVPFGLTGLITGIWASDGAGAALATEFS